MKITKLEHSGIIVEENGALLVCDPVEIEQKIPTIQNVEAIVVTHGHGDHYQPDVIAKIMQANPEVKIFTTEDMGIDGAEKVRGGDVCDLPNFHLEFFSENHAEIIPGNYVCKNVGVVVNGKLMNPGDSFDSLRGVQNPEVLMVANTAPWLRIVESTDYIETVLPKVVIPFHNALNSEFGNKVVNNWLQKTCDKCGAELNTLNVGDSLEI